MMLLCYFSQGSQLKGCTLIWRKARVQSLCAAMRNGLNTPGGLYLHQVWWHKNNNQATTAQEKYKLIRSLSVLYQSENNMTPVCTWLGAKLDNNNNILGCHLRMFRRIFGYCLWGLETWQETSSSHMWLLLLLHTAAHRSGQTQRMCSSSANH